MRRWIDLERQETYLGDKRNPQDIKAASEPSGKQKPIIKDGMHIGWENIELLGNPDKLFASFISPDGGLSVYQKLIAENSVSVTVLGQTLSGTFKNRELTNVEKLSSLQGAIAILTEELDRMGLKNDINLNLIRRLLNESGFSNIRVD